MRIDPNDNLQPLLENNRAASTSAGSTASASSSPSASSLDEPSASGALGEDQAQLSGIHAQVQALMDQAPQLPESGQEKVNALRQAVLGGNYQPAPQQIAEAMFAHMLVMPAA